MSTRGPVRRPRRLDSWYQLIKLACDGDMSHPDVPWVTTVP